MAGDGTVVRVAARTVAVVDTNGAGDAFAAGMIDEVVRSAAVGALTAEVLGAAMEAGTDQAVMALRSTGVGPA